MKFDGFNIAKVECTYSGFNELPSTKEGVRYANSTHNLALIDELAIRGIERSFSFHKCHQ